MSLGGGRREVGCSVSLTVHPARFAIPGFLPESPHGAFRPGAAPPVAVLQHHQRPQRRHRRQRPARTHQLDQPDQQREHGQGARQRHTPGDPAEGLAHHQGEDGRQQ
jgi:hypothetical protein